MLPMQIAVCTIASMVSLPSAKNVSFRVQNGTQGVDVISYDFSRNEVKNLHYENSIWSSEQSLVSPFINEDTNSGSDISPYDFGPVVADTATAPYKFVCSLAIGASGNGRGTAFFVGKNVLLTAAHCVYGNGEFVESLKVYPGKNGAYEPFGYFDVKKAYIPKEYKDAIDSKNGRKFDYDWAALLIDSTDSTGRQPGGNFGKISLYNGTSDELRIFGYPYPQMQETFGTIRYYTDRRLEYSCHTSSGFSGGPVLIERDGGWYVIGIHTASNSEGTSWGGTRINPLIYHLTNSLILENTIEIKNYHLVSDLNVEYYNCVGKLIANPENNSVIQTSINGVNFSDAYGTFAESFFTTSSTGTFVQYPFSHFRIKDSATGRTQPVKALANSFSESERSGRYPMVNRTTKDAMISLAFDQATNQWRHGAGTGWTIKGSIVHENISRNIEVAVPFLGTRTSEEIEINGATFQLRCGPNVVSIKANRNIRCDQNTTFFAFGIA